MPGPFDTLLLRRISIHALAMDAKARPTETKVQ
jgi:hypothetical protein